MNTFSILPEGFRPDRIRGGLEKQMMEGSHTTRGMNSLEKTFNDSESSFRVIDPLPEMKATIEVRKKQSQHVHINKISNLKAKTRFEQHMNI